MYQNNNGNSLLQAVNKKKGFTAPTGSVIDGNTVDVTAIVGVNSPDGKGNVTGYVSYRHIKPVLQASRDFSFCNVSANTTTYKCAGSGTIPDGRFLILNSTFNTVHDSTLDRANPGTFRDRSATNDIFNFAPLNYFQRPDERYSGGFFAHYDFNKTVQAYSEFMFMDDHTVAQIAPSGIFGQTYSINCGTNPLLSAAEKTAICADAGFGETNINPNVVILKRNVEGGNRQDDLRHTDYRAVVGLKGDLGEAWHYDIYGQYGAAIYSERYLNDVSKSNTAKALNVVTDPATGQPVCQSKLDGTDPACVPYNIWTPDAVTPAAIKYLSTPGFKEGQTTEQVVSASFTGDLGHYGAKSPYAHEGVGIALGAEYRREALVLSPDAEFLTGDLAGQGAVTPAEKGAFDVKELFFEGRFPLVQDAPFAKDITLETGYRFAHYSSAGDNSTYKIQGEWAINDSIRIRGGYNKSVRAPNVLELFQPPALQLDGTTDICAGKTPNIDAKGKPTPWTQAACANTGVSAAQYGRIQANSAAQYNGVTGGNPNLKPESASTYSIGAVLTPKQFLPGASLTVDYFNTKITNVIQKLGEDNILKSCALTGDATICGLVHRAPGTGSLYLGTNGFVTDTTQNIGFLKTSGIDIGANYRTKFRDLGLGDLGGISLEFLGTYTHDYQVHGLPGLGTLNCAGQFGTTCQGTGTPLTSPIPKFRSKTRLTWTTPWYGVGVSLNWRYIGPSTVDDPTKSTVVDAHIPSYSYFDLSTSMRVKDRYNFRIGVNNLFDKDPPVIGQGELPGTVGSGNTFAQAYDVLGRYIFMGVTADF
jgi:outer membrane receptor protein involved in Fe transport